MSRRKLCPEDEAPRGEEPLLESRRLYSRLREVRLVVLPCRGLLESRWMRFAGQVGADEAWEYAVRRAKRSEHAALMVDGI